MSRINSTKVSNPVGVDRVGELAIAERRVKWVYNWLFISAFLTVPWMLINVYGAANSYGNSTFDWIRAALVPALPHLLLLKDRKSPHPFVRAHARQALLLAGVRAFSAAYFIGLLQGEGVVIWFFVNGFLWIFGTVWGRRQVRRGDCWLVRQRIWNPGAPLSLPRPWALPPSQRPAEMKTGPTAREPVRESQPVGPPATGIISQTSVDAPNLNNAMILSRANRLQDLGQDEEARTLYVTVFRQASGSIRDKAIRHLEEMGEVEAF